MLLRLGLILMVLCQTLYAWKCAKNQCRDNTNLKCHTLSKLYPRCRDQYGNCRGFGHTWKYNCYTLSCNGFIPSVVEAKCCVRSKRGCMTPLDCRSPGDQWPWPGLPGVNQTCRVESFNGRFTFHYFSVED